MEPPLFSFSQQFPGGSGNCLSGSSSPGPWAGAGVGGGGGSVGVRLSFLFPSPQLPGPGKRTVQRGTVDPGVWDREPLALSPCPSIQEGPPGRKPA